jgi:hypothetical protein
MYLHIIKLKLFVSNFTEQYAIICPESNRASAKKELRKHIMEEQKESISGKDIQYEITHSFKTISEHTVIALPDNTSYVHEI